MARSELLDVSHTRHVYPPPPTPPDPLLPTTLPAATVVYSVYSCPDWPIWLKRHGRAVLSHAWWHKASQPGPEWPA